MQMSHSWYPVWTALLTLAVLVGSAGPL